MAIATRAELSAQADAAHAAIEEHAERWGSDLDTMPPGQRERRERLNQGFKRAITALEDHDARAVKIEEGLAAAADPANLENGFGGPAAKVSGRSRVAPFAHGEGDDLRQIDTPRGLLARAVDAAEYVEGLPPASRALLVETLEADNNAEASAFTLAALDPNYRSAFEKYTADPFHGHLGFTGPEREAFARVRAAMATTTESTGGALVPFTLDPSILLTSAVAVDPFRQLATVVRTLTPSWTGVKSAGVNFEWVAEGATVGDGSPTFSRFTIEAHKAAAYLISSYELLGDTNVAQQLPALIEDARGRIEAAAFVSGSGSGAPKGILTALGAGSTVTSTTSGTFTVTDLYALVNAVPARARAGRSPAFLASYPVLNHIRQFDTAGGASLWTNLGQGTPQELLGYRVAEASSITSTIGAGNRIAVVGDMAKYVIVDRLGTTVVPVPAVTDASNGNRPTGQYGWYAYIRVGGDVADADAFRVARVKS